VLLVREAKHIGLLKTEEIGKILVVNKFVIVNDFTLEIIPHLISVLVIGV